MENQMFCYQCQETAGCKGCTVSGVCGKKPEVARMQDLLIYVTKGLSAVTTALRKKGKEIPEKINHLVTVNLFTTITNANFDLDAIEPNHAAGVKLIFLILTVASAGILFYYVTAALKMSKRKPYG